MVSTGHIQSSLINRFIVIEDYLHLLQELVDYAPDIFFQSSAFSTAFHSCMTAFTLVHTDVVIAALNLFHTILTHECLEQTTSLPNFPLYTAAINNALEVDGFDLVGCLLNGVVGDFEDEAFDRTVAIIRVIASYWPSQLVTWLPTVLQGLSATTSADSKTQFLSDVTT